jgi:hypothetical protein
MVEKQKPEYDVVKRAAHLMKKPEDAKPKDIKRMAGRILNDEKNAYSAQHLGPASKLAKYGKRRLSAKRCTKEDDGARA